MKNKNANYFGITITAILSLLVVGTLGTLYAQSNKIAEYSSWKTTCKTSVADSDLMNKKLKLNPDIICPTYHLESGARSEKDIMKEISKSLYDCWDIFNRGDVNILDWNIGEKNYCVVCNNLAFDKETKISSRALADYMIANKIPNTNLSYADFLANGKEIDFEKFTNNEFIDTSETYDTVFTYRREVDYNNPNTMAVAEQLSKAPIIPINPVSFQIGIHSRITGFMLKTFFSSKGAVWESGLSFVPTKSTELQKIGCDIFPLKQYTREK